MNKKTILILTLCGLRLLLTAAYFLLYKEGKPMADLVVAKTRTPASEHTERNVKAIISGFHASVKKCGLPPLKQVEKAHASRPKITIHVEEKDITKADEYMIDFPDPNTMRIRATVSSLKFAFDDILERYFSVRYLLHTPHWLKPPAGYSREIEYIYPKLKNVAAPRKEIREKASFNFKRYFSGDIPKEWRVRMAFSGMHGMGLYPFPASKYAPGDTWPKEILPIHGGKRFKMPKYKKPDPQKLKNVHYREVAQYMQYMGDWQPCFSNPASVTIAVQNLLELLEKKPVDYYGKRRYNINMDVNDNGGNCECARCLAVVRKSQRGIFGINYSELYWNWVNKVAEGVTKKYPHIYFNCLAYREVTLPPTFKLHPNVIPMICRELNAGSCPVQKKKIEELFKSWKQKAKVVFLWDYSYGSKYYVFPRIFYKTHAEMMKMAYRNNVRGIYCEGSDRINMGGPGLYLIAKTMWDVNADIDKLLKQWCIDAVGPQAAPELEQYYRFWENYWLREDIRKTNHFNSVSNIYMTLGDAGSYTYAIRKGELAALRKLLENVVRKAQTPDQKARAKHFLNVFAISEDAAKCLYSEYTEPDGYVKDAAAAVELLRSVPEAVKAYQRLAKNPLVIDPRLELRLLRVLSVGVNNFRAISKFVKDPAVCKELDKLAGDQTLPAELRAQVKILRGVPFKNLMERSSFEGKIPPADNFHIYRGRHNSALATHGKRSFGGVNPLVREIQHKGIINGKTYMVLVDVYAAKNSAEGFVNFLICPQIREGQNSNYILLSNLKLNQGWQTLSNIVRVTGMRRGKSVDQIFIQIWGSKFEKDEPIYYDNIRIYQLD